ncbi:MAG: trypsin-like serine protease, partial [Polyangiaceae bacterium]
MKLGIIRSIRFVTAGVVTCAVAACTGASPDDAAGSIADDVSTGSIEVVHGVADRNRDPAVIAIDIGGEALCSGSLIAPNVVLTARHCVSNT